LDPSFVEEYFRLAKAQLLLCDFADALETIERGLAVEPTHPYLRRINDVVHAEFDIKTVCHKTTLYVPDKDFHFFGGLRPGNHTRVPPNSLYSNLHRPPLPPFAKKQKTDSHTDKRVRHALDCFYKEILRLNGMQRTKGFGSRRIYQQTPGL